MAAITESEAALAASRKRKAHKKSRLGCRNCKLRRVKCDETRPECTKCKSFGVTCNYERGLETAPLFDPSAMDLQLSVIKTESFVSPLEQINKSIRGIIHNPPYLFPATISDESSSFELDGIALARLGRFQARTVLSVGSDNGVRVYQNEVIKLAYTHPYLMHVVQTLTAIHDRYLSHTPTVRSTAEIYHWSQAATLFNQRLSKPLSTSDSDALWATGALIGVIAFALIDAATPEEAWPLKPSSPDDLDWFRMCEGKMIIRDLADPTGREDSVFRVIASAYRNDNPYLVPPPKGIEHIAPEFRELYEITPTSTAENNPYYTAIHALMPLLRMKPDKSVAVYWFAFLHLMGNKAKDMLAQKDPRMVAMVGCWYAKMFVSRTAQWWVKRRALLEGKAIVLWVERFHSNNKELLKFVGTFKEDLKMDNAMDSSLDGESSSSSPGSEVTSPGTRSLTWLSDP